MFKETTLGRFRRLLAAANRNGICGNIIVDGASGIRDNLNCSHFVAADSEPDFGMSERTTSDVLWFGDYVPQAPNHPGPDPESLEPQSSDGNVQPTLVQPTHGSDPVEEKPAEETFEASSEGGVEVHKDGDNRIRRLCHSRCRR